MNVHSKLREGWSPVRADEYPDYEAPIIDEGRYAGVIGQGGLMLAVLGEVVFTASADLMRTWSEAKRSRDGRWAQVDVYGAKPRREFQGPGLATINFTMRFDINHHSLGNASEAGPVIALKTA